MNSQIREVLATTIMREARDAVLREVVITEVEVTNDLSVARVYWHPLPGVVSAEPEVAQVAFDRAAGFFRKKVGEVIRARVTPELRFIYDAAVDRGRRVDEILHGIEIPPSTQPGTDSAESVGEGDEAPDPDDPDETDDDDDASRGQA